MKTDQQDNFTSNGRRRWLEAMAAGLAGVAVWKLGERETSAPLSNHATETPAGAGASLPSGRTSITSRSSGSSKLAVRPAAGAVKRHA
jgi:hypothetical protein